MIQVYFGGHSYRYELERLIRMFLSTAVTKIDVMPTEAPYIAATIERSEKAPLLSVVLDIDGQQLRLSRHAGPGDSEEMALSRLLYEALAKITGAPLRWGLLTGVRPVKLVRGLMDDGLSWDAAKRWFADHYLVSEDATDLAFSVYDLQEKVVGKPEPDAFGLYISIPFCPTRCSYCSFVSHSVEKMAKLIPDYINCLCDELCETGDIATRLGLKLTSVYIGGGTPTVLDTGQLFRIMDTVRTHFNMHHLREYTVEAGRPDTITREKLTIIREGGADRISINPQTLDDAVLRGVGRGHTSKQFFEAFNLARSVGFPCINTDLIAGLPGDTLSGFACTVDRIIGLEPENITIHTLSIKRAAHMGGGSLSVVSSGASLVGEMLGYARPALAAAGQYPYYLYRQQNMLGDLENVGYAQRNREGLYNIIMMEEIGAVIAVGAGGVTRLIDRNGHIERIFALKYPYEYITRPVKRVDRKARIEAYYEDCISR